MGESSKSIWYHLGYALESARHGAQSAQNMRSGKKPRHPEKGPPAEKARPVSSALDQLITTGTGMLGDRLFSIVAGRSPGRVRLTRAALAGAGAALAVSLLRNGKNGTPEAARGPLDPTAALLEGAARGMLYGAVLEPRLPGSPLLRGATFGVMEYVTSPFGGLGEILGASSPHRTVPILAALLGRNHSGAESMDGSIAAHVAFGVTLGLLYGEGSARRGNRAAE
jgi:hypothetical protein